MVRNLFKKMMKTIDIALPSRVGHICRCECSEIFKRRCAFFAENSNINKDGVDEILKKN
jgi:hypothetical protein